MAVGAADADTSAGPSRATSASASASSCSASPWAPCSPSSTHLPGPGRQPAAAHPGHARGARRVPRLLPGPLREVPGQPAGDRPRGDDRPAQRAVPRHGRAQHRPPHRSPCGSASASGDRFGTWNASLLAGGAFIVAIGIVMLVLPPIGHLAANTRAFGNHDTETPLPLLDASGNIVYPGLPRRRAGQLPPLLRRCATGALDDDRPRLRLAGDEGPGPRDGARLGGPLDGPRVTARRRGARPELSRAAPTAAVDLHRRGYTSSPTMHITHLWTCAE